MTDFERAVQIAVILLKSRKLWPAGIHDMCDEDIQGISLSAISIIRASEDDWDLNIDYILVSEEAKKRLTNLEG